MRFLTLMLIFFLAQLFSQGQTARKQLPAKRISATFKIDGELDEPAWKEVAPATGFVEQRPNAGKIEDYTNRTEIYLLYDNTSIYVGGYCHEQTKDSISRELVGRDKPGINDLVGLFLDTYNDKSNAVGFYVTPYGEQYDQKYSLSDNRDISWNAVWSSAAKIHADGWSFEMRIPYSALRFVSKENQTWGLNFVRTRTKRGQQFTWNPVSPQIAGFVNQAGEWTGIEKIDAPLRLSFSPYLSTYVNNYKLNPKPWTKSVNGGMDVKYGISESFTLDMTLVPDFGQVPSDNIVLNLSPFETQYSENRSFFTEGTELFNKGNLFYSRRIGGTPLHYYDVYNQVSPTETVVRNPQEARLMNATKLSGRTSSGLGIGFFNAVTQPMYAEVEDNHKQVRKIETSPLTNYNIIVLDQSLKNHSSVSFINTSVLRSGADYDANVSAALFNFNDKKNAYNFNGKFSVSHVPKPAVKGATGFSENLNFGKTAGRFNFQVSQEIADDKYNINDMGILFSNNYVNHYLWTGYRWLQPRDWYKSIQVNFNAGYRRLFTRFPGQLHKTGFTSFSTNVNANAQFNNLWWAGLFIGYIPEGNDFYEPHETGRSFISPERVQFNAWFETNSAKKYQASVNYFVALKTLFKGSSHELNLYHRYRFSDKFSLTQSLYLNPSINEAGYYSKYFETVNGASVLKDVIFSRRDRTTIENILSAKYNFNNRAGITFRARHYWSKVHQQQLYDLQPGGRLLPTTHNSIIPEDQNFNIINIDAVYTWQFAPGSFVNIVWKDQCLLFDGNASYNYFKNFNQTFSEPQNNNLSLKIIYYLDYLDFRKRSRRAG